MRLPSIELRGRDHAGRTMSSRAAARAATSPSAASRRTSSSAAASAPGSGHGRLIAWNPETGQKRNVTVWPEVYGMGGGAEALKYRFQWTFPIEFSPHDADTLYICSNFVHRSTDDGASWETISPDLTRNDPSASSAVRRADHRRQQRRRDLLHDLRLPRVAARTRRLLGRLRRRPGPPLARRRPELAERHAAGAAGVGADQHHRAVAARRRRRPTSPRRATSSTTSRPYLFKTSDYGATWTQHHRRHPGRRFHARHPRGSRPARAALLPAPRRGIYVSFDDGANWQPLRRRICRSTPIHDLIVKGTDLVAATHGRSFWILDDITPLHQLQAGSRARARRTCSSRATRCAFGCTAARRGKSQDASQLQDDRPGDGRLQTVEAADGETTEKLRRRRPESAGGRDHPLLATRRGQARGRETQHSRRAGQRGSLVLRQARQGRQSGGRRRPKARSSRSRGEEEAATEDEQAGRWPVGTARRGYEPLGLGLPLRQSCQTRQEEPQRGEDEDEGPRTAGGARRVPGPA